jgi:hypothetical protein
MKMLAYTDAEWEAMFAPYDEQTYEDAVAALDPNDIVLDIGAGDLRFANRVAQRVKQVIAIEQRAELMPEHVASNVQVLHGDARTIEFPPHTIAVLLMRHCQHVGLYLAKVERAGGKKVITNARWGMNVEVIDLQTPRISFSDLPSGWYACTCGCVGFQEQSDADIFNVIEVKNCPACAA